MLKWFREVAPIQKKLSLGFGFQVLMTASCFAVICSIAQNLMSVSTAFIICGVIVSISALAAYVTRQVIARPLAATVQRIESLAERHQRADRVHRA